MPGWAIGYLVIFFLITAGGIYEDLQRPYPLRWIGGEILTACFIFLFVLGYFESNLGETLGIYVFPMLIISLFHEWTAAKRTLEDAKDSDLSRKESAVLHAVGGSLIILSLAPGYLLGFLLGLRNIGL